MKLSKTHKDKILRMLDRMYIDTLRLELVEKRYNTDMDEDLIKSTRAYIRMLVTDMESTSCE